MHQITVTFSEKRPKKSWYQLYSADEHVPWEQWYDHISLIKLKLYSVLLQG